MKSSLPVIIDKPTKRSVPAKEVQSVPAVAVPIPVKKNPASLPVSGENSYVDQHRDVDLIHGLEKLKMQETNEEIDDPDAPSKFGIAWGAADFEEGEEDVDRNYRGISKGNWVNCSGKVSFDDKVEWWRTRSICPGNFYRTKGSAYETKVLKNSVVNSVAGFSSRLLMLNLAVIDFGLLSMAIHGPRQSINLQPITRMLLSIISTM
jgi:hypothetical protein